ncbi:MAG: MEKHLA domain-containing protein [Verrucomicrobia bacterium]|nr:MEKHLA domain-containing protein [Verrucomicrobiota bacterium]NBU10036.1 MEKHLA domain-containing protein [Pseudomonadota bacterium]NDA66624.1 MEKHLA domain-containing protein [Verrucomicrobiota bacterium]NDD38499.1 MEKHLA domain-containing protein [Verrucomicrobiota bacterium]NDE98349.1 MEKHLA domain-containing protein [Verrucomicrobiota bacterium]
MIEPWATDWGVAHAATLARSFRHWLRRDLPVAAVEPSDLAQALFSAPFVLVSHGTQADPVLTYGNRAALALWEMSWDELTRTPSRLTAEPVAREDRARLLAEVTQHGHIANYAGVRISKFGRRFRIAQAIVWNLLDEHGAPCGQAAMFDRWDYL